MSVSGANVATTKRGKINNCLGAVYAFVERTSTGQKAVTGRLEKVDGKYHLVKTNKTIPLHNTLPGFASHVGKEIIISVADEAKLTGKSEVKAQTYMVFPSHEGE